MTLDAAPSSKGAEGLAGAAASCVKRASVLTVGCELLSDLLL